MSSIPPRFPHLGPTLTSLLAQNLPAAQVILYVPHQYRRFPDWDGQLPQVPEGVTLRRTATDYGPATKILPALQDFAGQSVDLLFCDDDMLYAPGLLAALKAERAAHPRAAICAVSHHLPGDAHRHLPRMQRWDPAALAEHLARLPPPAFPGQEIARPPEILIRQSGYADVLEGWGGVMVRPEFFDARVFDIPQDLWMVDDLWLSGHLALRGVPIWTSADISPPRRRPQVQRLIAPLFAEVIDGKTRQDSNRACVAYYQQTYGIWPADPPPASQSRRLARRVIPVKARAAILRFLNR